MEIFSVSKFMGLRNWGHSSAIEEIPERNLSDAAQHQLIGANAILPTAHQADY